MLIPIRDHNPTRHTPILTLLFIAANVFFYLAIGAAGTFVAANERAVLEYGAFPCDIFNRCPPDLTAFLEQQFPDRTSLGTIFTSMFMHADLLHLGFNMLFLWVFGNNVEDQLGKVRFAVFYIVCGLAAAFAHFLPDPGSVVPVVGASGAVSGVLGAYIVLFPHARVVSLVPLGFFFWTTDLPAWVVLGLWFVVQFLGGLVGLGAAQAGGGGVAYLAHVGGFVAGLVLIRVFLPGGRKPRRTQSQWLT
jgi:membrane associated rhomboid family serine protease